MDRPRPKVIFEPQYLAEGEWQIRAHYPKAVIEYISGFKSEDEANGWIRSFASTSESACQAVDRYCRWPCRRPRVSWVVKRWWGRTRADDLGAFCFYDGMWPGNEITGGLPNNIDICNGTLLCKTSRGRTLMKHGR
jgi:hypothetical protein